jgi:hypothetical protein
MTQQHPTLQAVNEDPPVFGYPFVNHIDQALKGPGDVFVLVVDQIEFSRHRGVGKGYGLQRSHPDLFADHPPRDDGDAQPLLHGGFDRLVVGKFEGNRDMAVVSPDVLFDTSRGPTRSWTMSACRNPPAR